MEPIHSPIQQPLQTPIQIHDFQPKSNYLKTVIFFALVIVTLGLIAYLIFQNQKLQKLVSKPQLSPTIQASSPTPKTVSSISLSPDETTGWKTYINTEYGFTFKYPQNYLVKTSEEITGATPFNLFLYSDNKLNKLLLTFNFDQAKINYLEDHGEIKTISPTEMPNIILNNQNYTTIKYFTEEGVLGFGKCFNSNSSTRYTANVDDKLQVSIYKQKEVTCNADESQNIIKETTDSEISTANQILSTFKFEGPINLISCTNDSDCGVNICDCKADLEKNILVKDKICTRYCPGIPKCISSKCILIK